MAPQESEIREDPVALEQNGSNGGDGGGAGVYRIYKRRWFGLGVLMLMNIIISWGWLTFSPISTTTRQFFGFKTDTPVNWLSTVIFFSYAVAAPATIFVLNRHGVRSGVLIASVLTIVGMWLRFIGAKINSGSGGVFGVVMLGQILIGFAQPFVLSAPTHFSDMWFTSRSRVSATALASLSNPLGAAIGQLVDPFLATSTSEIPNMLMYIAIIATVVSLPSIFVKSRPPLPPCPSSSTEKLPLRKAIRQVFNSVEFFLMFSLFSIGVGFFNASSSLLNQILEPYGYSEDQAGIGGAIMIVVGLIACAIVSPIIDRSHSFLLGIRVLVPIISLGYIALIFAPQSRDLAPPYVVLAIIGAASFSLLPLALEFSVEVLHPVSPELTSTILWVGGQIFGAIFLIIMDALRDNRTGSMKKALIFQGVGAALMTPFALLLGFGSRKDKVQSKRIRADEADFVLTESL